MNRLGLLFLGVLAGVCLSGFLDAAEPAELTPDNFFDMSLEQLMEVRLDSVASLTKSSPRLVPASVTTITQEDIAASGARSLFELLDIYVPNLQWLRNTWEPDNLGLRGIISDRDDKYLLTVNGKVMNDRMHYGAISERDLVLLKDIHHIDIIRGPGSALYGPGAVSMVINIVTHSGLTFEGTDVTFRSGAVEEFYSTEIRHGRRFADRDGGLFTYVGIGKYNGADKYDAPVHYGFDFPTTSDFGWNESPGAPYLPGDGTAAGEAMTRINMPADQAAARGLPPIKLFAQYDEGNWTYWLRYTRGGQQFPWTTGALARVPYGWTDYIRSRMTGNWLPIFPPDWSGDWGDPGIIWYPEYEASSALEQNFYQYQQLTGYVGYETNLSEQTDLSLAFSYDLFDYRRRTVNWFNEVYREDEYYGRAMIRHSFNDSHRAALGVEVSHHELGRKAHGYPDMDFTDDAMANAGVPMNRWSTNLYSLFGEYQWTISEQWTAFFGGRIDDHTYSSRLFSPRASLIYAPTKRDVYKLLWARSVRTNFEEEMRANALVNLPDGDPEILDNVELRYERAQSENLDLAASLFWHYNLELISYSAAAGAAVPVGTQRNWGFELEASYHTEATRFTLSHGFTKLYDFSLSPGQTTIITSQAYGYGDDGALWSNHVTKLTFQHKLSEQWSADGSMRIYWGFGGLKDFDEYQLSQNEYYPIDPDWKRGYRGNYYLNLGLQYRPNQNLTFRVDGMNLLGIFDKDLNKRNYGASGAFRSHAPSIGVSMTYKF
ncbi:MAG TPA: TonB-dependent receptor [Anaerohalosphaeraceae bacterium]|nr:TonB-dependent receptor [Anaerohalosphaeraceae bacterium]